MSKFAIIRIGTFQYNVEEGKEYSVPRFVGEKDSKFIIEEVLAVGNEKELIVGKPLIKDGKVELEILDQAKGEKITSKIYKAKSRYRRTRGFRKLVTKFKVTSINY